MRSAFKLGTFLSLCLGAAMASCGSDDTPSASGTCGNGVVEAGEACDGPQLPSGATCQTASQGAKTGGVLGCSSTCQFDLSACTGGAGGGAGASGM